MLLKVGELAKRTGLTVRALHHYDSIGLLRPSRRSDGGYRLYDDDDIARLHGIQALRRMGVPLAEVARLLQGGATLPALVAQQIAALDREIDRTHALRDRLRVMRLILLGGGKPDAEDWLASLAALSTLEQYFSVGELQRIIERWQACASEWPPLVKAIREAMTRDVPCDALEMQPLARRWMDLAARWMDGDLQSLERWETLLRDRPTVPMPEGMDAELLAYIGRAMQVRLQVLSRYIGRDGLQRLDTTLDPQFRALAGRAEQLMADGVPPSAAAARGLARDWQALLDRMAAHDPALRAALMAAYDNEPLIRAGQAFTEDVWRYVAEAGSA